MPKILSARQNKITEITELKQRDNSQQITELTEKLRDLLVQVERNK